MSHCKFSSLQVQDLSKIGAFMFGNAVKHIYICIYIYASVFSFIDAVKQPWHMFCDLLFYFYLHKVESSTTNPVFPYFEHNTIVYSYLLHSLINSASCVRDDL